MARPSSYPKELRERPVALLAEGKGDYPSEFEAIKSIATKLGIGSVITQAWAQVCTIPTTAVCTTNCVSPPHRARPRAVRYRRRTRPKAERGPERVRPAQVSRRRRHRDRRPARGSATRPPRRVPDAPRQLRGLRRVRPTNESHSARTARSTPSLRTSIRRPRPATPDE